MGTLDMLLILDSMEISNNGSSCLVMVLGMKMKLLNVKSQVLAMMLKKTIAALSFSNNVTMKVCLLESVMILHSLILIMKSDLLEFHNTKLSLYNMPCFNG